MEMKLLYARLSGIPIAHLPDEHPEVISMAFMTPDELTEKLWSSYEKEAILAYYLLCFVALSPTPTPTLTLIIDCSKEVLLAYYPVLFPEESPNPDRTLTRTRQGPSK